MVLRNHDPAYRVRVQILVRSTDFVQDIFLKVNPVGVLVQAIGWER